MLGRRRLIWLLSINISQSASSFPLVEKVRQNPNGVLILGDDILDTPGAALVQQFVGQLHGRAKILKRHIDKRDVSSTTSERYLEIGNLPILTIDDRIEVQRWLG